MRRRVGDVVSIPLGDGQFGFARVLPEPLVEFYDLRSSKIPTAEEITSSPVLFTLYVMNSAITRARWEVVAHSAVDVANFESPFFFKQDPMDPSSVCLYRDGQEFPGTAAKAKRLERAAVWSAEHVEERLRDHFAGRPNVSVEALRLQSPSRGTSVQRRR